MNGFKWCKLNRGQKTSVIESVTHKTKLKYGKNKENEPRYIEIYEFV